MSSNAAGGFNQRASACISGSLVALLRQAAERNPRRGVGIFDRRGKAAERRTYPEFLDAARRTAARLAALGVQSGDRVPVCLPTSWPALEAWFGAILRGALPVMLAPPGPLGSVETQTRKVEGVVERIGAKRLLCEAAFKSELARGGAQRAAGIAAAPEDLEAAAASGPLPDATPDPGATAFLQLTSGSTGLPRAVMISHRAALHNAYAIDDAVGAPHGKSARDWAESVVSWLPLYHDMGLIGCFVFAMANGLDLWLLRPETFLARPRVWLETLGRSGTALSPAPNFAYQLCAERVGPEDLKGVDLGRWRAAMTGAEMIRPETTAAFLQAFGPLGFDSRAFRACYGLAEGTLAVTFDRKGAGVRTRPLPRGADADLGLKEVVCTGPAVLETELRIAAPDGAALPEGEIGEVRAKGPSIFGGYYNDPEATAEGLRDGWLCTGDLGFLHGGELYLTGRVKDLLIVHGHNLMPHELEWVAESVTGGGGSERCGAFSVARGPEGEQAVLVMESGDRGQVELEPIGREIRVRVGRTLGLPLAEVVFVRRGQIPKTTSGKVQRAELRRRYLEGKLERL